MGIHPIKKQLRDRKALELFLRGAELGSFRAHFVIATVYLNGELGVTKDMNKALHHMKLAAQWEDMKWQGIILVFMSTNMVMWTWR